MFKVRLPSGRNSVTLDDGTTLVADAKGESPVEEHLLHKAKQWGCTIIEDVERALHFPVREQPDAPATTAGDPPAVVAGQRAAEAAQAEAPEAAPAPETEEDHAGSGSDVVPGDGASAPTGQ